MTRRVAMASLAGFALLAVLVLTGWSPLHRLDVGVADDLNRAHVAVGFFKGVSIAGRPITFQTLAVVAAILLWRARRPCDAAAVAVTVLLTSSLTHLVKLAVNRDRPVVPMPVAHAGGASFPSGHALASIVGVIVLLSLVPDRRRASPLARVAVGCGAGVVVLIGFSRLALGVHYVSDVVAGWLLGTAWALLVPWVISGPAARLGGRLRVRARRGRGPASSDRPRGTPSA